MKLKIEYMNTDELKPYANNAKIHTAEQIEQIKASIKEFGMNDPIAIWKNNEIIEGHGRLIACSELGIEQVPVIRLDELTDTKRKAYAIVHNKLTMNTDFDNDVLGIELKDVMGELDMTDLGFGGFELEMLTSDFEPEPFDDDEISEYSSETGLAKKRIIITYKEEEEETVKELLNLQEIKKIIYDISELA